MDPVFEQKGPSQGIKIGLFWLIIALISAFFFGIGYFYGKGNQPAKIVIEKAC